MSEGKQIHGHQRADLGDLAELLDGLAVFLALAVRDLLALDLVFLAALGLSFMACAATSLTAAAAMF